MVAILKLKPIMLVFRAYVTSQSTLGRLDNSDTVTTFCSTLCPLYFTSSLGAMPKWFEFASILVSRNVGHMLIYSLYIPRNKLFIKHFFANCSGIHTKLV